MQRSPLTMLLAVVAIIATFASAPARAGTVQHLDPTFGDGGLVVRPGMRFGAVANPGDGSFLVGGTQSEDFVVARFTSAGAPDPAFGTAGVAQIDVSGDEDVLYALAVQPDGKIIAVGEAHVDGDEVIAVARLLADGTLDGSFGTGGRVFASAAIEPYDIVLQADGGILLAGTDHVTSEVTVFALARFAADGTLDPSFGSGGVVHSDLLGPQNPNQQAWSMALQSTGKIVVTGYGGGTVITQDFLTARYLADGTLDTTFGDGGKVRTDLSPSQDIAWDVVVQPDDKIVLAGGYYPVPNRTGFGLVRYLPDGALDPSFGVGGIVRTPFARDGNADPIPLFAGYHAGYAYALGLLSDGRIVAAGDSLVARYLADGTLDASFGGGSIHTLLPGAAVPAFRGLVVQPDDEVVAVGQRYSGPAAGVLARFAPCTCPACQQCDGLGGCVAAPRTGCYGAATTPIKLRNAASDRSDAVSWKFSYADPIPPEAIGLPYATTDYAYCLYDESGPTPVVAAAAAMPAGVACGGKRCWKTAKLESDAIFKGDAAVGPIGSAKIKTGPYGQGAIQVKGKGTGLAYPPFPLGLPLRVQLQAENGQCWEAVYGPNDVIRSDAERFEAR